MVSFPLFTPWKSAYRARELQDIVTEVFALDDSLKPLTDIGLIDGHTQAGVSGALNDTSSSKRSRIVCNRRAPMF